MASLNKKQVSFVPYIQVEISQKNAQISYSILGNVCSAICLTMASARKHFFHQLLKENPIFNIDYLPFNVW
jgi:hypothetical protein